MKQTVIFLYIHLSGHKKAAESLQLALEDLNPSVHTENYEALAFAYPVVGRVISKGYIELLKHTPQIWDFLYDNERVVQATREIRQLLNTFNSPKLQKLIREKNPECLVCTQAVPCSVIAAEKQRGRITQPLIGVITDYAVHSYWIYPEVDAYFVANESVKRDMVRRGVRESRIHITGIPIAPQFGRHYDKTAERSRLGLDERLPTILLMGGSLGLVTMDTLINALLQAKTHLQIVAVTGLNAKLRRELETAHAGDKRIRVLGFTSHIYRVMAAADLLVTKPGGLTTSEALALGLPMLIIQPIPGQEERNSRYLIGQGAALRANSTREARRTIERLIKNPDQLREMSLRCTEIAKPNSSHVAAEIINGFLRHP